MFVIRKGFLSFGVKTMILRSVFSSTSYATHPIKNKSGDQDAQHQADAPDATRVDVSNAVSQKDIAQARHEMCKHEKKRQAHNAAPVVYSMDRATSHSVHQSRNSSLLVSAGKA